MQSRQDPAPSGDPEVPDNQADAPPIEHACPVDAWASNGAAATTGPAGTPGPTAAATWPAAVAERDASPDAATADLGFAGNGAFASAADDTVADQQTGGVFDADEQTETSESNVLKRFGTQVRRPVLLVNLVLGALILAGGGFAYASVAGDRRDHAASTAGSGIRFRSGPRR